METPSSELKKLQQSITDQQYKRSAAIIVGLGKGLTEEGRQKRWAEIKRHLKRTEQDWFLPVVYVKYAVQTNNMTAAALMTTAVLGRRKYRKNDGTINEALGQLLGMKGLNKLKTFTEDAAFDWKLLNWLE